MRYLSTVTFTAAVALAFAACDQAPTSTEATTLNQANVHDASHKPSSTTLPMEFDPAEFVGSPFEPFVGPIEGAEAYATVTRKTNGTLHWNVTASGMEEGHAYTVWLLNGDSPESPDGGHAGDGLVGGNGGLNASGNHCVSELKITADFPEGFGFEPGISTPNCDIIDGAGTLTIVLIDHGPWTPGDMFHRWKPLAFDFLWATFEAP